MAYITSHLPVYLKVSGRLKVIFYSSQTNKNAKCTQDPVLDLVPVTKDFYLSFLQNTNEADFLRSVDKLVLVSVSFP